MAKQLPQNVTITRNESEPESLDLVAASIIKIADKLEQLKKSGASERLIILLLNDATGGPKHGISKDSIKRVLDAVPKIREMYLR